MKRFPREITDAIREDRPIPAARFESLRRLTEQLVAQRGWPDPLVLSAFLGAGYTPATVARGSPRRGPQDPEQLHQPSRRAPRWTTCSAYRGWTPPTARQQRDPCPHDTTDG